MFCKFKDLGNNIKGCTTCGFQLTSTELPERIFRQCNNTPEIINKPTIGQKIENFAGAMVDWVKDGFATSSQEKSGARLEICTGNPEKGIPKCDNFENGTCNLCGCNLAFKTKLESSTCPIGKW